MKFTSTLSAIAVSAMLISCGGSAESHDNGAAAPANNDNQTEAPAQTAEAATYTVDAAASTVEWTGSKAAYGHTGTVAIKEGSLEMTGDQLTGGSFVIDMSTIAESNPGDEEKAQQLAGHLMSDDFFAVGTYPTSSLNITGVEAGENGMVNVTADLQIKAITKSISFPAKVAVSEGGVDAKAEFTINRAEWEVKYGSGSFFDDLGDAIISDDISYKVNLHATK